MTNYREILRLKSQGYSERNIALAASCSRNTVSEVLQRAEDHGLTWPLSANVTNADLKKILYPPVTDSHKRLPDYNRVRKELMRNGVTKKLLWTEYVNECQLAGDEPLMYSQFCYYIQQDEEKRRATMHINRKPGERVEVDWAGDSAHFTDPATGEIVNAYVFVGVMPYSQYTYAEAFLDEKQAAWNTAHVHMFQFFGGVPKILVPDNTKTAIVHNKRWEDPQVNRSYHELAEHYGTAIIPARIRHPKDKPSAEGNVGHVSTWIIAALRDEQFFSLEELNKAIQEKLKAYNDRKFQKKEGSRSSLFREEELPRLAKLPATPYETAEWKQATVQYNYHISIGKMLYSVPYAYIGKKVDVRVTESMIEVFYKQDRIASHRRLKGRPGQYSTVPEHMPPDHQKYLEWDGDRFRKWAIKIGSNTKRTIDAILSSKAVEQQAYRACMALLKLEKRYSAESLESACAKALAFNPSPSYKSVRNILAAENTLLQQKQTAQTKATPLQNPYGITRGAKYYGGENHVE